MALSGRIFVSHSSSSFASSVLARLGLARRASVAIPVGLALAGLIAAAALLRGVASAHGPSVQAHSQAPAQPASRASSPADHSRVNATYAALPLTFEPNVGQTDPQVKYVARGRGYSLFLTSTLAYFAVPVRSQIPKTKSAHQKIDLSRSKREFRKHTMAAGEQRNAVASIEMDLLGSNPQPHVSAENQLPGVANYLLGRDPSKWRSGVAHYGQVRYREVYPGVDLAYHGAAQVQTQAAVAQANDKFEFDFLINPGANPEAVKLGFHGSKGLRTGASGDLIIASAAGDLHLHQPFAYQELNGKRQSIDARFVIRANDRVSFALGNYDRNRLLVIDPTVTYSTYLGGSTEDDGNAITVDSAGNAYVTGQTDSTDFPAHSGVVTTAGGFDVFVTELNPSGALVFTTLVGGSGDDIGNAIAVDTTSTPPGIYIAGQTASGDFPIANPGTAVQPAFINGAPVHGLVAKLSADGLSVLWSTFIEGGSGESVLGLALSRDAITTVDDDVYVVGSTESVDLGSGTAGANGTVNPLPHGGSLNNGAGENGLDDGFIAKVSNGGTQYLFLSYLGGSDDDVAYSVAVNPSGNVYIAGQTASADFFTTPANVVQPKCGTDGTCNASGGNVVDDAFVVAIGSGNAPTYLYATFLGGEGKDDAFAIAADAAGNAYVTGQTFSASFPTKNPLPGLGTLISSEDVFVSSLNPAGTALNYSTYLGGTDGAQAGDGIALDTLGNAYVTGYSTSAGFPVTSSASIFGGGGAFGRDAFVSDLSLNGSSLSLPFSTYLGGSGDEDIITGAIAVDVSGNIYVTGDTNSSNFPLTNPADGTYNAGSSATCAPTGAGLVPCPDAFVTVYAPNADFSIVGTPLAAVSAGGASTSTISVAPFNCYSNAVNLTCSVSGGGTPAPTCQFSSNSISGGSGTSTLTVTTTAQVPGKPTLRLRSLLSVIWLPVGIVLAGGGLLGAGRQRKNRQCKKMIGSIVMCALLTGTILLSSCGGGSSSSTGGGGSGCSAAPAVPSSLAASGTTTTATSLNWTADTAPSGCSLARYTVYENGTSIGTPTATRFAVSGLSPSTTYSFTIAATDTFGTSAQSAAASVTTGSAGTPSGTYTITVKGTDGTITPSITPATTRTG